MLFFISIYNKAIEAHKLLLVFIAIKKKETNQRAT